MVLRGRTTQMGTFNTKITMKLKEAKEIVGKMVLWVMMAKGLEPKETPQPITEDLKTLLKANDIVEKHNKKLWGASTTKQKTICMVLDERGIAAVYVAANFTGTSAQEVDVLAMHEQNIVLCLDKSQLKD